MVELKGNYGGIATISAVKIQSIYGRIESLILIAIGIILGVIQSIYGRIESSGRSHG